MMVEDSLLVSSLEGASKNWSGFDWSGKAKQWETTTSQNKEAREQSLTARKSLSETTKQFKRSVKTVEQAGTSLDKAGSPENSAAAVKAIDSVAKNCRLIVKAYQEEIDNLTRRCKASETAFGSLVQSLNEVPDPAAVLATAMEHLQNQQKHIASLNKTIEDQTKAKAVLEKNAKKKDDKADSGVGRKEKEELIQLRKEVAEYEVEFRSLKNQDITIRKLEARIVELQKGSEEEFETRIEAAKQELVETEGRRTAEALEREAAMERRVQTLELQLKAEMAGRAATQAHLLEASEGVGEREAAWEAQRRILVDDSERLRHSLHEASRERDELRLKVEALSGGNSRILSAPSSGGIAMADLLTEREAYEAEVRELSHTVNSLREEIALKDNGIMEERRNLQSKIDTSERELSALKSNLSSLETQLAAAPSPTLVENMKRELRILKRLEYNADDTDLTDLRDPEMTGGSDGGENDLESVLVAKLRRVEAELVKERNQRSDSSKECEQLKEELASLQKEKADCEKVITSLEHDLDRAISSSASPSKPKRKAAATASEGKPETLQSVLDPDAPPPPANQTTPAPASLEGSAAEKAADDHSVATIIMAQRDRLRARCEALEAERDSFKRELQAQVDAAESLKADNTKLFEKMRYLQSYNNNASSGRAYARSTSRDLDLEALEQRYEASVDPFRQFGRAERQRKLREMSPMERTVFVVAKTVLGTKEMRTFLFFYVVALHTLVFLTTYHWSHSDSGCSIEDSERLSHLPPVAQEAVKNLT